MKKILIISYFFPPCNLTASQRAYYWAKHLKDFGYDPVVLTRKWDTAISSPSDIGVSSKSFEIDERMNEQFRVVYMPFKGSLRDRIFIKKPFWSNLRKALTLKELYLQNYRIKSLSYSNIFFKAEEIILKEKIEKVIITGNPFACFHFGYQLKRKFPRIKWIADYRDDWTTTELVKPPTGILGKLFKLEQKSEKKWVRSASFFTSVSEHYVNKIESFTGVKGYELINGFGEVFENLDKKNLNRKRFEVTYNGSLYRSQPVEPFLSSFKKVIKKFEGEIHVHLNFPGLAFDKNQAMRVKDAMKGFEGHITITERIPREEVIEMQLKSNVLLMVSHSQLKGIPSSKLYEYIGLKKPVLLFPNDKDIIEKTLLDSELGVICEDENDIETKLGKLVNEFIETGETSVKGSFERIQMYTRKNQVKKLAKLLDKL